MSEEVQVDDIDTSTVIHRSCSAETLSFGVCCICEMNTDNTELDTPDHVTIVKNLVVITCSSCHQRFHMKCLEEDFNLDKLLDIIEGGYTCFVCRE